MGLTLVQTDDPSIQIFFIEDSPHRMNKRRILMPVQPPKEIHSERNALRDAIDRALCGKTDLQKKADDFLSSTPIEEFRRVEQLQDGFILFVTEDGITKITEDGDFFYRLFPVFTSPKEIAQTMSLNWNNIK